MNISRLSLTENYQSLTFGGVKTKAARKTLAGNKTLKDILNLKKRSLVNNTENFVYTYDRLLEEYKKYECKINLKKQIEAFTAKLKAKIRQEEIDKKTCKTFLIERAKYQKDIYKKLIARCFEDFDNAILEGASQDKIQKLADITDLFISKFSRYEKLF